MSTKQSLTISITERDKTQVVDIEQEKGHLNSDKPEI